MYFFEYIKKPLFSDKFIYFLVLLYFTLPHEFKFNISEFVVIKFFDFVALLVLILRFNKIRIAITKISDPAIYYFFLLFLFYFFRSLSTPPFLNGYHSILFSLKFFEYLVIIITIYSLTMKKQIKLFHIIFFITLISLPIKYFDNYSYNDWGNRWFSIYGGPYELSAISLIFLFYYKNIFMKLISFAFIFLSGTKATFISLFIYLFQFIFINIRYLLFLFISLIIIFLFDDRFLIFSKSILNIDFSFIKFFINSIPFTYNQDSYYNLYFQRENFVSYFTNFEPSMILRFHTYIAALKSIHYENFLFGNGPGYYGVSLDSSPLRIFCETGIAGLFLFFLWFFKIFKNNNIFIILSIFITLLLSDVFFSARFLPFTFLYYFILKNKINES